MPIADSDTYRTDPDRPRSFLSKIFLTPKFMFYPQVFRIIWVNSRKVTKNRYGDAEWAASSLDILRTLENVGMQIEITGMENFRECDGPVVFISNHMSTLETFVLPCIIRPVQPVTFIVKKSLLDTPVFGLVMRSRDPIVVTRTNPREDLKTVLEEGTRKIQAGISIIVFPQSTRSAVLKPEEFNTLGVKLALRAGVKVVPLALKTDAWGTGTYLKDFGPIDVRKKIYFAFGRPMAIQGRGAEEHQSIIRFIQGKLDEWEKEGRG